MTVITGPAYESTAPRAFQDRLDEYQAASLARGRDVPITPCPLWCELGPGHAWEWEDAERAPERMHLFASGVAGLELTWLEREGCDDGPGVVLDHCEWFGGDQIRAAGMELLRLADVAEGKVS